MLGQPPRYQDFEEPKAGDAVVRKGRRRGIPAPDVLWRREAISTNWLEKKSGRFDLPDAG